MNIYLSNLSFHASEENLHELFSAYGEVSSTKIITDKFSGRSRGFAFVEMPDDEQAIKAINELNNTTFHQRTLNVNEAIAKEDNNRNSSSRRY